MGKQGINGLPPIFNYEEKSMQKTLIAVAIAGLMSGAAFAQTSVTIGGKFDAGYQFKRTANADDNSKGGAQGGSTTETLGDGAASTSRITVSAKETISSDLESGVSLDLRFGTIEEGKNTTTTGGLNSNDKKLMYLQSNTLGKISFGVINLGDNYFTISAKPYMVEPKDLEIVKYGVATYRYTALSSRLTEYLSPTLNLGSFGINFHVQYAFGDNAKSGASNTSSTNRGNAWNTGIEWKFSTLANGGVDVLRRTSSVDFSTATTTYAVTGAAGNTVTTKATTTYTGPDSFGLTRLYVNVYPIANLKVAATYINQGGYGQSDSSGNAAGSTKTGFQDKITNLVVSYNFNGKAEAGVAYSIVRDVGEYRNSGHGLMIGGAYFLSKSTYLYGAWQKTNWERNQKSVYGGKYDGTGTNFAGNADKLNGNYTRVGIVKEF